MFESKQFSVGAGERRRGGVGWVSKEGLAGWTLLRPISTAIRTAPTLNSNSCDVALHVTTPGVVTQAKAKSLTREYVQTAKAQEAIRIKAKRMHQSRLFDASNATYIKMVQSSAYQSGRGRGISGCEGC